MKNSTNHESFILKPSTIEGGGIGVFAVHDIQKDTRLELFTNDFEEEFRDKEEVPTALQGYCLDHESGKLQCPKYFNRMDIGNYLNHSQNANTRWDGSAYYATRDIQEAEEIFSNYKELGEPEHLRDSYIN